MRALAIAALLSLASSTGAQSSFERSAGPYATLDALDLLRLGDRQLEVEVGGGWRVGNGLDAGLRLASEHTTFDDADRTMSEARRLAIAVEAGYTAWIGSRAGVRLDVLGGLQQTLQVGAPTYIREDSGEVAVIDRGNQDINVGGVRASVTAFRRVPVGRLALQPTVGAFLGGDVEATVDADRPFTLRADTRTSRAEGSGGVSLGLPVLARVGNVGLALVPRGTYDVARDRVDVGVRLRANF